MKTKSDSLFDQVYNVIFSDILNPSGNNYQIDKGKDKIIISFSETVAPDLKLVSEAIIENKGEYVEVRGKGTIEHEKPRGMPIYERDVSRVKIYTDPIDYGRGQIIGYHDMPRIFTPAEVKKAKKKMEILKNKTQPIERFLKSICTSSELEDKEATIVYKITPTSFKLPIKVPVS